MGSHGSLRTEPIKKDVAGRRGGETSMIRDRKSHTLVTIFPGYTGGWDPKIPIHCQVYFIIFWIRPTSRGSKMGFGIPRLGLALLG